MFSLLVLLKEIRTRDEPKMQEGYKIPLRNPSGGKLLLRSSSSYNKLLGRVAFRILSNIHEGAPLQK